MPITILVLFLKSFLKTMFEEIIPRGQRERERERERERDFKKANFF